MNRTLTERARSLLHDMQVEKKWCTEAMDNRIFATNRVTCASHSFTTPSEFCFGSKMDMSYCAFSALRYMRTFEIQVTNIKAFRFMLLGYAQGVKGYLVRNYDF